MKNKRIEKALERMTNILLSNKNQMRVLTYVFGFIGFCAMINAFYNPFMIVIFLLCAGVVNYTIEEIKK